MKKYIGTKQIEAEPMTMGEAFEKGLLRANEKPDADYAEHIGYHVKYKDGYESWSPAEPFEEAYKCADTFLDRLRIEYANVKELFVKYEGLGFDEIIKKTDAKQAALLLLQIYTMKTYVEVLEARIEDIEQKH